MEIIDGSSYIEVDGIGWNCAEASGFLRKMWKLMEAGGSFLDNGESGLFRVGICCK